MVLACVYACDCYMYLCKSIMNIIHTYNPSYTDKATSISTSILFSQFCCSCMFVYRYVCMYLHFFLFHRSSDDNSCNNYRCICIYIKARIQSHVHKCKYKCIRILQFILYLMSDVAYEYLLLLSPLYRYKNSFHEYLNN